jgi:hypothetical protein
VISHASDTCYVNLPMSVSAGSAHSLLLSLPLPLLLLLRLALKSLLPSLLALQACDRLSTVSIAEP